jgi:D-3-phosphoglycerate dehydrogenase
MKQGAYLINASRGSVVVIEDLVASLKSKHIAGCAIDVFPSEPASNAEAFTSPLQGLDNVILTPHIGGSTEEAQVSIGEEVSDSLIKFLHFGISAGAVNFPNVDIQAKETGSRLTNVHRNEPGILGMINSIISESGANIGGQSLATNEDIGYIIIDVDSEEVAGLETKIKNIDKSIITRVVY